LILSRAERYNGSEAFLLVFRDRRNRVPTDFTAPIMAASNVLDHWLAYKRTMGRLPGLSVGLVYKDRIHFFFRRPMDTRTLNNNDQPAQRVWVGPNPYEKVAWL
jgi:hypothetical protein